MDGLRRVRDLIASRPEERRSAAELERVSGLDRWTLARQFRLAFGTSPSRFRTLRQLDRVRALLGQDVSLAEAALDAGFADQSHMTRHFKQAYGLTPARWTAAAERV
jgi:AraC-like DNA-binding protein